MSPNGNGLVYDEPTVMWRMRRGRQSAHAVIAPRPGGAVFVWFVNDRPVGVRDFTDWGQAINWSDQMRAQNWAIGWRLAPEVEVATHGPRSSRS
jgi:hypothetical protein